MLRRFSILFLASAIFQGCTPRDDTGVATNNATARDASGSAATLSAPNHNAPPANASADDKSSTATSDSLSARATLVAIGDSNVAGEIRFTQKADKVTITGKVTGLKPGEHGFHIHEKGDLSDTKKGESVGGHYNPDKTDHGHPTDVKRHAGDFGNISAGADGVAEINLDDSVVKLDGPNSVVGRAVVIHADADKFTQPSGDAGGRIAFGKVELDK